MTDRDAFGLATWEDRGGEYVLRLCHDLGLTTEQAAGLVGNLGYESAGFDKLQEIRPTVKGSRGGYGVAQWTGPRRRAFEKWAADRALAVNTDEANYGFLLHELKGSHKSFLAQLRKTDSLDEACHLTHRVYEVPSDVLDGSYRSRVARQRYAERAYKGALAGKIAPALPSATVADVQRRLNEIGDYRLVVDGRAGPLTCAAIMDALT